jgi:hypothetical protein
MFLLADAIEACPFASNATAKTLQKTKNGNRRHYFFSSLQVREATPLPALLLFQLIAHSSSKTILSACKNLLCLPSLDT